MFFILITNVDALKLSSIHIDGKVCSNTSSIETCLSGDTYSYDSANKVLTLNNYNGSKVVIYSGGEGAEDEIRVHLKEIGHPILGDFKYNKNKNKNNQNQI